MIYIIQYISYIYYNKILNSRWIGEHARVDSLSLSLSLSDQLLTHTSAFTYVTSSFTYVTSSFTYVTSSQLTDQLLTHTSAS